MQDQIITHGHPLVTRDSYWATLHPGTAGYRVFRKQMTNVPADCSLHRRTRSFPRPLNRGASDLQRSSLSQFHLDSRTSAASMGHHHPRPARGVFMPDQPIDPVTPPERKGPKNIVICCDGTGNEFSAPNPSKNPSDGQNSNVVKLYTALCVDNAQVAYYHPGVGTMGAPAARYKWTQEWTKIMGLAFGAGFRDNVFDAYRYLMERYSDNDGDPDHVYLFGFSRGAYTVRALAGLLYGYGLLCRGNEGHLPYAWRMYLAQHGNRNLRKVQPDVAFRETFSHRGFKIHFIGVWDTVSSVGWIYIPDAPLQRRSQSHR